MPQMQQLNMPQQQPAMNMGGSSPRGGPAYYKDVMKANSEIKKGFRELKVHQMETAAKFYEEAYRCLKKYSKQSYPYQVPMQGGMPKTGPQFT